MKLVGWERDIIERKIWAKLDSGVLSEVKGPPQCIHGMFVVPKDDGGGRTVINCSKPEGKCFNNHTKPVRKKFHYLGVDNVVDMLEKSDYLSSIDIKDTYRAVSIHLAGLPKQGIRWRFQGAEQETYGG